MTHQLCHRCSSLCSYNWVDDETIVACVLPPGVGEPPPRPRAPLGPKIEDNSSGRKSQARTYPDLLKSPYDEKLFEYYTTSQLVTVSVSGTWQAGLVTSPEGWRFS